MKRTAETQLTRDNADNGDDVEEGKAGFQKADADSLATREIRALPKRPASTAVSTQPTSTDSSAPGSSRFGGFSGFGITPSNKDDMKSTVTKPAPSFPSFIGFGPTKVASTSINPPNIPSTSGLNQAPTAYQDASTTVSGGDSAPKTPIPTDSSTLTKYFTDLRGLNNSFVQAVKDAVEADPFVDLSGMVEIYRTHRGAIQKERDSNDAKQTPHTATSTPSAPSAVFPASTTFTAPSTNFTFGASNLTPAPPTTTVFSSTSGSSWPSFSSSSTDKASAPSFSFGASKTPSYFVFGESSSTEGASAFKSAATTEKQSAEASDKSSGSSTTVNFFKPQSAPITPGFSSFLPPPSLTTTPNSQPSTSSTPLTFESDSKGNIGNVLGFSFGGPSKFPAFSAKTTASAPTGSETTSSGLLDVPAARDGVSTEGDENATPENVQTEHNNENQYDKDGAGEEDEETQFETRSKAYISLTTADGKKSWSPVGTGQLKLKKQKEGTKRRLLMRNSSNGKIIINTLLVPGFKLTVEGKTISFLVPNTESTVDLWKLRLSTEADAKEWETKVSEN